MALSAGYVTVVRIPIAGLPHDGHTESNISATTSAFPLHGGIYGVIYKATWGSGTITLQVLAPDAVTWIIALTAFSADGCTNGYLPPGSYRFAVA